MFSTFKQRLLLGLYVFLILSIPVGAYLVSQQQIIKSNASGQTTTKLPKPTTSPAKELLNSSESDLDNSSDNPNPSSATDSSSSPTIATSFGPTLSLKIGLEGRPAENQATKLFVGIVEGILSANPKFLLSFSVDLPASGEYSNLSLAGLNSGTQYTALLKGQSQIATSSGFIMSPTVSNLNEGQTVNLLTGDLNDDNVINSADYSIVQASFGATSNSTNWNENADFNSDGVVNIFDLGILSKNLGKVGASGAWISPIPTASPSAGLVPAIGGPEQNPGYWLWIPK